MDYATSLDLKSAFHHITISPNSTPYLAFNFNKNNYAQRAMPFGTKLSPIFFAEAIQSILREVRMRSEVKILNYCDDILLIHQNKDLLKRETMNIWQTLENFGWRISKDKCEIEPKQIITFLGWILNIKNMQLQISEERKEKLIQALKDWCKIVFKNKLVKIRQLVALIERLNFLRPQFKEASLYLITLDKAKTDSLKENSWDGYTRVGRDSGIQQSDRADPTRCVERGGDEMDEQRERNNGRLLRNTQFRRNLQKDAEQGYLSTFGQSNHGIQHGQMESEGIISRVHKKAVLFNEKIETINRSNSHSRSEQWDDRFTIKTKSRRGLSAESRDNKTPFHNAFNYSWTRIRLYIHPPIPVIPKVLTKMKQDNATAIIIAPIWQGQTCVTELRTISSKFLFLGQWVQILIPGRSMKDKGKKLPPGDFGAFLLDLSQTQEETY
ncbi:MAG: hypothetical protein EZS28_041743 [Streblomastix strix]|uniref:Reverse transcriptase domain-containing protein n=1 Tax=Streblomastix strix TaxID=222440 RepID=A0A5J4TXD9_9EUKA|nr:MAG: hypothetical protein EZS28_041743 [Streblomastix strix]